MPPDEERRHVGWPSHWSPAHGKPALIGTIKTEPEDFRVEEIPITEPTGDGQHAWLWVEKRGRNTDDVARALAELAGCPKRAVGFAGLKDRDAVTRQVFTVGLEGRPEPDWSALALDGVRVIDATRHQRKLRRGALRGNRFRIVIRQASGDAAALAERLGVLTTDGVPNYFGAQRFGADFANIEAARALFAGHRVRDRHRRGLYLSAARSYLFNEVLARRTEAGTWNRMLDGEVLMLDGSRSVFGPESVTAELIERVARRDIHPTGPLWGAGNLRTSRECRELELCVAAEHRDLSKGLSAAGLEQDRRALRVMPSEITHEWLSDDRVSIELSLPPGAYATVVLRELFGRKSDPT